MKTNLKTVVAMLVSVVAFSASLGTAKAARYEELSVTKLNLAGVDITNTPARLNAAGSAGDNVATPSATIGTATIQTNASVGGTLQVSGVLTLSASPKLPAALTATGTAVVAAGIRLPEGYSTNANKLIEITVGTTNYLVPAYVRP